MITAKEAKYATDKTHKDWEDSSWAELQNSIDNRIHNGHYTLQAILVNREQHNLKSLGYTVEKVGSSSSTTYTIGWQHINKEIK